MATVLPPAGYSSWVWIIINTWWEFTMIPSGFQWLKTCKRSKKKTNQVMRVIWCILSRVLMTNVQMLTGFRSKVLDIKYLHISLVQFTEFFPKFELLCIVCEHPGTMCVCVVSTCVTVKYLSDILLLLLHTFPTTVNHW